jgi:hypothetical protein
LGFIGEPRGFELMQFRAAFFAFPKLLSPQIGLEGFDFAQEYLDRVVERFDDVGRRFFAVGGCWMASLVIFCRSFCGAVRQPEGSWWRGSKEVW